MCRRRVTLPCSVQIDAACSVWLLSSAYKNRAIHHARHGMGKKSNMLYQKRYVKEMGISHSVLWACDHHWLHYDIRFPGGTYARSMRLTTVVSFTTCAVSLTGLSHYSPGILAFMRIPVSSSHVGVPVGTVAASWALFLFHNVNELFCDGSGTPALFVACLTPPARLSSSLRFRCLSRS